MNKAYIFLLKKRYKGKWNKFRDKLDYYLDFSLVYLIFLGFFFILFYRSIWNNPPVILQGVATLFGSIPLNFGLTISILLLLQFAIKGLTTPPMHYSTGDTYFLFSLPIPRIQYIFLEWFLQHLKNLFIVLALSIIIAPIFHILYPHEWLKQTMVILSQIGMLGICMINFQWLSFHLPPKIKRLILLFLKYVKIFSFTLLGIVLLFQIWMVYFAKKSLLPMGEFAPREVFSVPLDFNYFPLLLLVTIISIIFSIVLMKSTALEYLKEASKQQNQIKTLNSLGMTGEAKKLGKRKDKKEKRYFLSIPGYYRNSKIFLWRNLSQFIKQPGQYLFPYGIYLFLSIGVIFSTKGNPMSLLLIFYFLYILGQSMLFPLQEHYEANYFLSSFPIRSVSMLRGYLLLPFILSTLMGLLILGVGGWLLKDFRIVLVLAIVLPFFSYYTLLTAMRNVLEEIYVIVHGNKTLHMEAILLLQGIAPIVISFVLLNKGIPLIAVILGTAIVYLLISRELEKSVIYPLQKVFHKYC